MKHYDHLPRAPITTITEEQWKRIVQRKTYEWLQQRYKQPEWCDYPGALKGLMGCWSLISWPWRMNRHRCSSCDCCKAGGTP